MTDTEKVDAWVAVVALVSAFLVGVGVGVVLTMVIQ